MAAVEKSDISLLSAIFVLGRREPITKGKAAIMEESPGRQARNDLII